MIKIIIDTELIGCERCGVVLKNIFLQNGSMDYKVHEEQDKYLTDNKSYIISNYADLEQEDEEYRKYCPICNSVRTFKPIIINEDD